MIIRRGCPTPLLISSLAVCWVGAAVAQEVPAIAPGAPVEAVLASEAAAFRWDAVAIEWVERRYKVEAVSFTARSESGVGWWGSDEVMVETTDAEGGTVSEEIGDINSGDTHAFDPALSCIVGVRPGFALLGGTSACHDEGMAAPFGFAVTLWEVDLNFPAGFCIMPPAPQDRHMGPHCVPGRNDDFIGRSQIQLSASDLEAPLAQVGDTYVETVVLSPCESGGTCGGGLGPWSPADYAFTYRITRLPDQRVDFLSQLGAAMRRSGIASPTEAVAAGLRALPAATPRTAEPVRPQPSLSR